MSGSEADVTSGERISRIYHRDGDRRGANRTLAAGRPRLCRAPGRLGLPWSSRAAPSWGTVRKRRESGSYSARAKPPIIAPQPRGAGLSCFRARIGDRPWFPTATTLSRVRKRAGRKVCQGLEPPSAARLSAPLYRSFAGASGPPFQIMAACASRRSPRRSSL